MTGYETDAISVGRKRNMKTVRIQYEIPEDRLEALDALMKEAGMKTRTELFIPATFVRRSFNCPTRASIEALFSLNSALSG